MPRYNDEYEYAYDNLISNCDDLYLYDDENDYDEDVAVETEWENYYHNIADELVDE